MLRTLNMVWALAAVLAMSEDVMMTSCVNGLFSTRKTITPMIEEDVGKKVDCLADG